MAGKPCTHRRVRMVLLVSAAVLAVGAAVGIAQTADVQPPTITVQPFDAYPLTYPPVQDGMTISDGTLRFRAELYDVSTIVIPPVLRLDGNALPASVFHSGSDGEGEWDQTRWWVIYSGVVPDGVRVLTLSASDAFGNAVTATYHLNVVTRPTITEFQPVSHIGSRRPAVSASVGDVNTAIDPGSIALTLNGVAVPHSYDPTAGTVTHVPSADLANESYHTAVLTLADAGGLSASQSWVFYVTTYADMADSNIDGCTSCHPPASGTSLLPWEAVHAVRFGGSYHTEGGNDCWVCHGGGSGAVVTTAGFTICGQCHGRGGDWLGYGEGWYHGQHAAIAYVPAVRDPALPVRIGSNREMVDCVVCHQPGVTTLRTTGVATTSHDIPELHKSVSMPTSCDRCHARSLTREHARDGRRDQSEQPITCSTCHRSSNANVLGAIAARNTDCLACHLHSDYAAVHHAGCNQGDCLSCHGCSAGP